jgi:hypothetical protein
MSKREHRRFTAKQKLEILREADQPGLRAFCTSVLEQRAPRYTVSEQLLVSSDEYRLDDRLKLSLPFEAKFCPGHPQRQSNSHRIASKPHRNSTVTVPGFQGMLVLPPPASSMFLRGPFEDWNAPSDIYTIVHI